MTEIITEYYNNDSQPDLSNKWWTVGPEQAHQNLFATVKYVEKNQSYRSVLNLRYARLYSNVEMLGLSSGTYARTTTNNFANNRVTYNVVKSCVDTASAKIA